MSIEGKIGKGGGIRAFRAREQTIWWQSPRAQEKRLSEDQLRCDLIHNKKTESSIYTGKVGGRQLHCSKVGHV